MIMLPEVERIVLLQSLPCPAAMGINAHSPHAFSPDYSVSSLSGRKRRKGLDPC